MASNTVVNFIKVLNKSEEIAEKRRQAKLNALESAYRTTYLQNLISSQAMENDLRVKKLQAEQQSFAAQKELESKRTELALRTADSALENFDRIKSIEAVDLNTQEMVSSINLDKAKIESLKVQAILNDPDTLSMGITGDKLKTMNTSEALIDELSQRRAAPKAGQYYSSLLSGELDITRASDIIESGIEDVAAAKKKYMETSSDADLMDWIDKNADVAALTIAVNQVKSDIAKGKVAVEEQKRKTSQEYISLQKELQTKMDDIVKDLSPQTQFALEATNVSSQETMRLKQEAFGVLKDRILNSDVVLLLMQKYPEAMRAIPQTFGSFDNFVDSAIRTSMGVPEAVPDSDAPEESKGWARTIFDMFKSVLPGGDTAKAAKEGLSTMFSDNMPVQGMPQITDSQKIDAAGLLKLAGGDTNKAIAIASERGIQLSDRATRALLNTSSPFYVDWSKFMYGVESMQALGIQVPAEMLFQYNEYNKVFQEQPVVNEGGRDITVRRQPRPIPVDSEIYLSIRKRAADIARANSTLEIPVSQNGGTTKIKLDSSADFNRKVRALMDNIATMNNMKILWEE